LMVTMSQKSTVLRAANSVLKALMPDRRRSLRGSGIAAGVVDVGRHRDSFANSEACARSARKTPDYQWVGCSM
jgi:hypothetical protein